MREMSLQAPRVFIDPEESQYSQNRRMFQGIAGIERADNGRLWVSYMSGSTGEGSPANYVLLITSDDDGKTWSGLKLVVDMPDSKVRLADPCLWIDPTGTMWFFWRQAYQPWVHGGVWAMTAENPEDADPVWSEPRRLCEGGMLNKPVVLSNNDWLFPVKAFQDNLHISAWETGMKPTVGEAIVVMSTNDRGNTFTIRGSAYISDELGTIHVSEPMMVERKDGTLWMLVRTGFGIGETVSADKGNTWTPVRPHDHIRHTGSRFFFRRLNSGNLLLVKHGRIDERTAREHLTAFISTDDGQTWKGGLMLDERHVSYPDGIQAPDGRIYVIYDHGRYPGTPRELLMAVFTEDDVLAGTPSPETRLKTVVSKALEPLCDQKVP